MRFRSGQLRSRFRRAGRLLATIAVAGLTMMGAVVARAATPAGNWSDRFATDNIFVDALETSRQLAVGGDSVYSGAYRLENGRWTRLGDEQHVDVDVTAASDEDVYIAGYSRDDGRGYFVAHWDGTTWTTLVQKLNERVFAMVVHNGELYIGGWFTAGEDFTARNVARWDGSSWSQVGEDPPYNLRTMTFVGDTLYVGGGMDDTGFVSKWNGSDWTKVGVSNAMVHCVVGLGDELYAGGRFFSIAPDAQRPAIAARRIAKWDGIHWSALGAGIGNSTFSTFAGPHVRAMTALGSDLIVGGYFDRAGASTAKGVARWNGNTWSAFGTGTNGEVDSLAVVGSDLYLGGFLDLLDGATVGGFAKWNGKSWSSIGDWGASVESVRVLRAQDGTLYAGGYFETAGGTEAHYIASWDGVAWSAVGGGMDDWVYAIAFDGSDVLAGGRFLHAGGHNAANVARWNGNEWSGLGVGPGGDVYDLLVVGDDVLACGIRKKDAYSWEGFFARWDGSDWSTLAVANGGINTMATFDGGLYVGGNFTEIGGVAANRVARRDGDSWAALGQGFNRDVNELAVRDGMLWAVGSFYAQGNFTFANAAIWTGSEWMSAGVPFYVETIEFLGDDAYIGSQELLRGDVNSWEAIDPAYIVELAGLGSQLYMSGFFETLGDKTSHEFGALATGNCGNGVLDESEQCDPGVDGTGTCCNLNDCTIAATGTICRPLRGPCDVAETCDGLSTLCPDDEIVAAGTSCSEDADPCAPIRECDGEGISCPVESLGPCDDGNPCNGTEICLEDGSCSPGAVPDCEDDLACTADACDLIEACVHDWTPGPGCAACGDADEDEDIDVTDALLALRAAVSLGSCPRYLCDYDGSGKVTTSDALRILQVSIGTEVAPQCPTRVNTGS